MVGEQGERANYETKSRLSREGAKTHKDSEEAVGSGGLCTWRGLHASAEFGGHEWVPNGARTRRDRKHLGEGDFRPRSGGEISEVLIENYRLFIHHMETSAKCED